MTPRDVGDVGRCDLSGLGGGWPGMLSKHNFSILRAKCVEICKRVEGCKLGHQLLYLLLMAHHAINLVQKEPKNEFNMLCMRLYYT